MLPDAYQNEQDQYEDVYDLSIVYSDGVDGPYSDSDEYGDWERYAEWMGGHAYTVDTAYETHPVPGLGPSDDGYGITGHQDGQSAHATGAVGRTVNADDTETYPRTAGVEYDGLLEQYGLDTDGDWTPFDAIDDLLEPDEGYDVVIDADSTPEETGSYGMELDEGLYERLLSGGTEVYGRSVDDGERYVEIAEIAPYTHHSEGDDMDATYEDLPVVEHEMPDGLFGFVDPSDRHPVAHVNKALYKVDKERTRAHEASRKTGHPSNWAADELMIRYRNGDIDVENTMSFQANNVSRIKSVETGYMPWTDRSGYGTGSQYDVPEPSNAVDRQYAGV